MPERAHLAIGSNLNERRTYLEAGLAAISALPDTSLAAVSHIYETPPWDRSRNQTFSTPSAP